MDTWDICIISACADAEIANRLAESIRKYRLPAGITLPGADTDYRRVLLDTQETAFNEQVRLQLEKSRFLVLLCSPDAKNSAELKQRLDAFYSTHDREKVIAVIVNGEPEDAFPERFIERKMVRHILPDQRVIERMETIEPIAADLRAENTKRQNQLLRYETVRIVASVMDLHPDDLERRQQTRQKKTIISILTMTALVVLILSVIFIRLGLIARKEGRIADEQTRLSVKTAERTMEELPELFADEPLALEYIEEANQNAKEALAELGLEGLLNKTESGEGS